MCNVYTVYIPSASLLWPLFRDSLLYLLILLCLTEGVPQVLHLQSQRRGKIHLSCHRNACVRLGTRIRVVGDAEKLQIYDFRYLEFESFRLNDDINSLSKFN